MDKIYLPIELSESIGGLSPIHILVVVKGLDDEGFEVDAVMHTEGLSLSNALGMARYAVLVTENEVSRAIAESS